jgi:hypothetical protein
MLKRFMHHMERKLHARDLDQRTGHPFEWGFDHLDGVGVGIDRSGMEDEAPLEVIRNLNRRVREGGDWFFRPGVTGAGEFELTPGEAGEAWLRYPSGIVTPYRENNLVQARYYRAGRGDRAVIVSPQWNADEKSHIALCRLLNRLGISALRLSLPYHDRRRPPELKRADYMISANIGRTIQAVRQAVMDIRRAADWLQGEGVERIGVIGSSIGSCVSWLAFIHDARLEIGVFNMVSSWFGDVVWRAITTSHVRAVLEPHLTADEVREAWSSISPSGHVRRRARLISARYDLTFLPDLTEIFVRDVEQAGIPSETRYLPCGHYTIGRTPFKYLDAWHIVDFVRREWSEKQQ